MKYQGEKFKYVNIGKVFNLSESLQIMEKENEEELTSCCESKNQDNVRQGQRRFICKYFSHDPIGEVEEISDFAKIAAPHVFLKKCLISVVMKGRNS